MNREIKFKYVWQHDTTKEFKSKIFTLSEIKNGEVKAPDFTIRWDLIAELEYTGLIDYKGNEIYESDIMQSKEFGHTGEIVWNEKTAGFKLKFGVAYSHIADRNDYMEVVGNIYEHPHLIAGSNAV